MLKKIITAVVLATTLTGFSNVANSAIDPDKQASCKREAYIAARSKLSDCERNQPYLKGETCLRLSEIAYVEEFNDCLK